MSKRKFPITSAIRALRSHDVSFEPHLYDYEERGGTRTSSRALGVPEPAVIKTLIMEDDGKSPLVVLMHGDAEVSTKNLARQIGVKSITVCDPQVAQKHSGYQVGGTSPFGTRKSMPVYAKLRSFPSTRSTSTAGKGDSSWPCRPRRCVLSPVRSWSTSEPEVGCRADGV